MDSAKGREYDYSATTNTDTYSLAAELCRSYRSYQRKKLATMSNHNPAHCQPSNSLRIQDLETIVNVAKVTPSIETAITQPEEGDQPPQIRMN